VRSKIEGRSAVSGTPIIPYQNRLALKMTLVKRDARLRSITDIARSTYLIDRKASGWLGAFDRELSWVLDLSPAILLIKHDRAFRVESEF
jgi:hypothetical protein